MEKEELEAIKALLKRRTAEQTRTPETARQWLIEEGIYDAIGGLQPQYGGLHNTSDK